jgi:hypothetical protein
MLRGSEKKKSAQGFKFHGCERNPERRNMCWYRINHISPHPPKQRYVAFYVSYGLVSLKY